MGNGLMAEVYPSSSQYLNTGLSDVSFATHSGVSNLLAMVSMI
jgi:hypothetical protein